MQINVSDLRIAAEKLLAHVEEAHGASIEIDADFYWNIPEEERLDPYKQPSELEVGQLVDDWDKIQKFARGQEDPVSYGLVWLSALLRTIGDKLVA